MGLSEEIRLEPTRIIRPARLLCKVGATQDQGH